MKPRHLLLFFAIASLACAADLKLTDGRTFKDYRILSPTPTTVVVRHAGGAAKIPKQLLPADVLKSFPIDEEAAAVEAEQNAKGKALYEAQAKALLEQRAKEHAARLEKNKPVADAVE